MLVLFVFQASDTAETTNTWINQIQSLAPSRSMNYVIISGIGYRYYGNGPFVDPRETRYQACITL